MKQVKLLSILTVLAVIFTACGGGSNSDSSTATEEASETTSTKVSGTYQLSNDESTIAWKGEVAGVYGHNGVIDMQSGTVTVTDGKVTGGEVVIDMTTIQPLDTASYEASGKTPQDLVDHLSTGDFFLVEEYPTASFVIKRHEGNSLVGDLTIRGNTNEEIVELTSFEATDNGLKAEGKLIFDRQNYDVKWEHYVEDYVLSDDIELTLNVAGK
ncbi:YceI family protein [Ekhidna sp.]|uniref:YceI family protein n=1 Tax=Ekhidna sp. TaxID=2608089 RepID=UPI003CCB7639